MLVGLLSGVASDFISEVADVSVVGIDFVGAHGLVVSLGLLKVNVDVTKSLSYDLFFAAWQERYGGCFLCR